MRNCHQPDVPCHRVIASGGRLGGYGGSELLKRGLLMAEGIPFSGLRIPHVHDVLFHGQRPEELARRGTGRAGSSRTKGRW
jgi:methylated-DNA-[protein]-cysteine S-methyltransferase